MGRYKGDGRGADTEVMGRYIRGQRVGCGYDGEVEKVMVGARM